MIRICHLFRITVIFLLGLSPLYGQRVPNQPATSAEPNAAEQKTPVPVPAGQQPGRSAGATAVPATRPAAFPASALFTDQLSITETTRDGGLLTIAVKGGLSAADLVGSNVSDSLSPGGSTAYKPGLLLGVSLTAHLHPTFWLRHELLLQQQGAIARLIDTSPDRPGSTYASRYRLTYLTLYPAMLTWARPHLQLAVGPYLGLLLAASRQVRNESGGLVTDHTLFGTAHTLGSYASRIDAGIALDAAVPFGNRLTACLRFQRGFLPVLQENPQVQTAQPAIYTQTISLTASYRLGR